MFRKTAFLVIATFLTLVGVSPTVAVQSPCYTNEAGAVRCAIGVFILNPDGTSAAIVGTALTYTNASVSSATGASQTIVAASATRTWVMIVNPATTTWWINVVGGTAAANCAGCFELPPGASWVPRRPPANL